MGLGGMYWMTFPWPWPKVTAVASISKKIVRLHDKVRNTHRTTIKHGTLIALVMAITWLNFKEVLL